MDEPMDEVDRPSLAEGVDGWCSSSDAEDVSQSFSRLVERWGMEDVLCMLAERHGSEEAVIAKKALRTDCFRCEARESDKRLHVAYYYWSIQGGGAQRVAAELCGVWAGMKDEQGDPSYEVTLITDGGPLDDEYPLDPRVRREYLPERAASRGGSYQDRYRAWQRIVQDDGLDVVVSGMWMDSITLWDLLSVKSASSRPAFMLHCHNFTMIPNLWPQDTAARLMYFYELCDGVAVLSSCDRSYVERFSANVKYIPNPVSYVADNTPAESEGPSIVWMGRIASEKQPLDLVRMMGRVVEQVPDAKLYLVGEGDERLTSLMHDEVVRLGLEESVEFTGFTLDVDARYGRAAVFVNTSSYEGFPLTIAEALSHSLPVVMYDLPWLEFVRDGRGIRVVEQGRYDLLADEVVQLLKDPEGARRLGREGRGQIDDLLEVDIGAEWEALFRGIDPDARPAGWDTDERVLFQYLTEYRERTLVGLRRQKARATRLESANRELKAQNKRLEAEAVRQSSEVEALRSSNSWKVGRFITWLPRKIKALIKRIGGGT